MTHRLTLILGGARAGKSTFALTLAQRGETALPAPVTFVATARAFDTDMARRIDRHRAERPEHWMTVEEPLHLDRALAGTPANALVIVDCLTLFASNWLLELGDPAAAEHEALAIIDRFLDLAMRGSRRVACVTNEVGLGVVPPTPLGRDFREMLGRVNQRVAARSDRVFLLVAGIPMKLDSTSSESAVL